MLHNATHYNDLKSKKVVHFREIVVFASKDRYKNHFLGGFFSNIMGLKGGGYAACEIKKSRSRKLILAFWG